MSNNTDRENRSHRKSKVSWAMAVIPGSVGPKARPKGIADGQPVNIPALLYMFRGVTQRGSVQRLWNVVVGLSRRVSLANPGDFGSNSETPRSIDRQPFGGGEARRPGWQEKLRANMHIRNPYRKPTQVDSCVNAAR